MSSTQAQARVGVHLKIINKKAIQYSGSSIATSTKMSERIKRNRNGVGIRFLPNRYYKSAMRHEYVFRVYPQSWGGRKTNQVTDVRISTVKLVIINIWLSYYLIFHFCSICNAVESCWSGMELSEFQYFSMSRNHETGMHYSLVSQQLTIHLL